MKGVGILVLTLAVILAIWSAKDNLNNHLAAKLAAQQLKDASVSIDIELWAQSDKQGFDYASERPLYEASNDKFVFAKAKVERAEEGEQLDHIFMAVAAATLIAGIVLISKSPQPKPQ